MHCFSTLAKQAIVASLFVVIAEKVRSFLGTQGSPSLASHAVPSLVGAPKSNEEDAGDGDENGAANEAGFAAMNRAQQKGIVQQILILDLLFMDLAQFAPLQRVVVEALQLIAQSCPDVNAPAHHGARARFNALVFELKGVQHPVIRRSLKANIEPHNNCRGLPAPTALLGRVILGASRLTADPDTWELQWYLQAITRLTYWQLTPEGRQLSGAAKALIRVRQQVQNPTPALRNRHRSLRFQVAVFTDFLRALRVFMTEEDDIAQCDTFIQEHIEPVLRNDLSRLQRLLSA